MVVVIRGCEIGDCFALDPARRRVVIDRSGGGAETRSRIASGEGSVWRWKTKGVAVRGRLTVILARLKDGGEALERGYAAVARFLGDRSAALGAARGSNEFEVFTSPAVRWTCYGFESEDNSPQIMNLSDGGIVFPAVLDLQLTTKGANFTLFRNLNLRCIEKGAMMQGYPAVATTVV